MRIILILAAIAAVCNAEIVLQPEELTDDMINNPNRYVLYEREDGLFEVEDLYNATTTRKQMLSATKNDVIFYVFTQRTIRNGVKIKENQLHDIVRLTGFNVAKETLVVIHGWKSSWESAGNDLIKNAALKNRDINVILVDWSPIAVKGYITAQGSVVKVGNFIGDFLIRLDSELNHRIHDVTIVGHSLGAHIAGNAGARTKGVINTIVGLDPAGPLFTEKNTNNRLDPTDANYVHVIHSNDGRLGFDLKMGHVDYYPNGGSSQPGCGVDLAGACAHGRAIDFYAESLNNNNFVSRLCGSWDNYKANKCKSNTSSQLGGFPVDNSPSGSYYLATNKKSPYAKG